MKPLGCRAARVFLTREGLQFWCPAEICLAGSGLRPSPHFHGVTVRDVVFVLLTLAIFVLLGLVAKGAERL